MVNGNRSNKSVKLNKMKIGNLIQSRPAQIVGGIAILVIAVLLLKPGSTGESQGTTFTAKQGNLKISVLEGGNIEALESEVIRSEIEDREGTLILRIVPEGTLISQKDIDDGKVLVELDSTGLQDKITQQEITFQSTEASLTEAVNAKDIQVSENISSIKATAQQARFARLDFIKYMGEDASKGILDKLGLDKYLEEAESSVKEGQETPPAPPAPLADQDQPGPQMARGPVSIGEVPPGLDGNQGGRQGRGNREGQRPPRAGQGGQGGPGGQRPNIDFSSLTDEQRQAMRDAMRQMREGGGTPPAGFGGGGLVQNGQLNLEGLPEPEPAEAMASSTESSSPLIDLTVIDFSVYAEDENEHLLGDGQARQELRKLKDAVLTSEDDLELKKDDFEAAVRLEAEGFVTKNELQQKQLAFTRSKLNSESAKTELNLFKKYTLPKDAEDWLSKYDEALRELQRTQKTAVARLAQAHAQLKSAQSRYNIEKAELKRFKDQLAKCVIKATNPGLVVYGSGENSRFRSMEEQIREGATVRYRQTILRIPNTEKMAVDVKIHETYIKRIKEGQEALITLDAEPDSTISGVVEQVAVLPDSQDRWLNPDMKVYKTTIKVTDTEHSLKPGMSAKVEILIKELTDVVYVPIMCILPMNDKQFCLLATGGGSELVEVETGEFNNEYIEIRSGIKAGDVVLLRPPRDFEQKNANASESLASAL